MPRHHTTGNPVLQRGGTLSFFRLTGEIGEIPDIDVGRILRAGCPNRKTRKGEPVPAKQSWKLEENSEVEHCCGSQSRTPRFGQPALKTRPSMFFRLRKLARLEKICLALARNFLHTMRFIDYAVFDVELAGPEESAVWRR
jgi:hypothetical protein